MLTFIKFSRHAELGRRFLTEWVDMQNTVFCENEQMACELCSIQAACQRDCNITGIPYAFGVLRLI